MTYNSYADLYGPVKTSGGLIRGYQYDGLTIFKNIKYGSARRFHKPEAASWEGIRECTSYGFVPPQIDPNDIADGFYVPHFFYVENEEECLNLNLWTPSMAKDAKLPVVFCVYGASFDTGSGAEMQAYDGCKLAKNGNIVYVTSNMRANMLGFFDLSCFGEEYVNSGNNGFEDVLLALKWVRENIATFGGDPDNVTLLGMQGGALRIRYIMQCPAFKGYFHKAFLLSGIADHGHPPKAKLFHQLTKDMLKTAGYAENDITPLQEMDLHELHQLYKKTRDLTGNRVRWRVSLNGWCYGRMEDEGPCPEMTDIIAVCGNTFTEQNFTPDKFPEGRLDQEAFNKEAQRFGADKEEIIAEYQRIYPDKDLRDLVFYAADHRKANFDYCDALAKANMKVYNYQFVPEFPFNHGTPAFHCADVAYLTMNLELVPNLIIPGYSEKLMKSYSSTLINLAYYGDPGKDLDVKWEPYTIEKPNTILFDKENKVMETDDRHFIELMAKHMPERKKK
ncbi:MAG: carboxylesterase/lipase family protein [Erysipelotrichaceae bacterium]|nr:carboxylesterase/lipase family protein [Erysipelotrichaceae bacterium]